VARTRFAKAVGQSFETPERVSVRKALWFDVEAADTSDDGSLSDARVALFDHTALLLGATHLLLGATCLVSHPFLVLLPSLSNPLIPLLLILLLDGIAALTVQRRSAVDLPPHAVSRAICIYLAATGILWALVRPVAGH
jgi:hypothetical protein